MRTRTSAKPGGCRGIARRRVPPSSLGDRIPSLRGGTGPFGDQQVSQYRAALVDRVLVENVGVIVHEPRIEAQHAVLRQFATLLGPRVVAERGVEASGN